MRVIPTLGLTAILAGLGAAAWADETMTVAGHEIAVVTDGISAATLSVDGEVLHENGVIFLDPEPWDLGGTLVVTGVAGSGGNACNAPPFALAFPEGGKPEFSGPVDSCAYLLPQIEAEALVFVSQPLPGYPGEVWTFVPGKGFALGAPVGFAATAGWEAFDSLAGAHPAQALSIAPVLEALETGLGADYPAFAERISDLGSGDLTALGYLGQACLKATCMDDWALLYLDREKQAVFAAWSVTGDVKPRLWPTDQSLWPAEALAALPGQAEE